MFSISFWVESETNWYRVRLNEIDSSILVHRDVLVREVGMDARCEVGCKEVTIDRMIALGFGPVLKDFVLKHVD